MSISLNNIHFTAQEYLDELTYTQLVILEKKCLDHDKTALKLELDYKLAHGREANQSTEDLNEFMAWDGEALVGYIGIGCFDGVTMEVNGMVDPSYRKNRIFKQLYQQVTEEIQKRSPRSVLLLSDRNSNSGQGFIRSTGATFLQSEYEMYIRKFKQFMGSRKTVPSNIVFRKATNKDALEITKQNSIYFGSDQGDDQVVVPEDEEKRGMTIYLAELNDRVIGKVNLQIHGDTGAIFGLGVLPDERGKGYGKAILLKSLELFLAQGAEAVFLQVAAENETALQLYLSCGFEKTSIMDYYELIR